MEQEENKPSKEQVLKVIKKLQGNTEKVTTDANELQKTDEEMLDKLSEYQQKSTSQDNTEETKK